MFTFGPEVGIQHNSNGTAQIIPREAENRGERVKLLIWLLLLEIFLPKFSLKELQRVLCFSFYKNKAYLCDTFTKCVKSLLNMSTHVVSLRERESKIVRKISAKQD